MFIAIKKTSDVFPYGVMLSEGPPPPLLKMLREGLNNILLPNMPLS